MPGALTTALVLVALACILAGTAGDVAAGAAGVAGAAGAAGAAGFMGIEARVDAIERKFAAELRQAEDRMSSELKQMQGELGRMGSRLDMCETALIHGAATVTIEREEEPEFGRRTNQTVYVGVLEARQMQKPAAAKRAEEAMLLSEEKDQEAAEKNATVDMQKDMYGLENKTQAIEMKLQQQEGQIAAFREECTEALHAFSNILDMTAEVADDRRRTQSGDEPAGGAPVGDAGLVRIFKRTMSSSHLSGNVDESNGGNRRLKARQLQRAQQSKGTCPGTTEVQSKCGSTVAAGSGRCIVCVMSNCKTCTDDDAIGSFCSGGAWKGGVASTGGSEVVRATIHSDVST